MLFRGVCMLSDIEIYNGIQDLIESFKLVSFQVSIRKKGKAKDIKVFVDHEWGGISIQECHVLSKKIADYLFQNQIPASEYFLEVSSPGIDKHMVSLKEFKRNRGRKVEITYKGESSVVVETGLLVDAGEQLIIETEKGEKSVAVNKIVKGKVIVQW